MKDIAVNTQEYTNNSVNHVSQELNSRGTRQLVDNRADKLVQRKLQETMNASSENEVNPIQRKNNTGLPDKLKLGIENLSGYSMDDVKVHYNSSKPAQLQAHAYAQGSAIHLASGQEKHLPHEAWHVVQQKQGRVKPTKQLKSKVNVNDDVGLEKEADVMGEKATRINSKNGKSVLKSSSVNSGNSSVQGFFYEGRYEHEDRDDLLANVTAAILRLPNRNDVTGQDLGFSDQDPNRAEEINILVSLLWDEYGEHEENHMEMDIIELAYNSCRRNDFGFGGLAFFDLIRNFNRARINLPWSAGATFKYDNRFKPKKSMMLAFAWKNRKNKPGIFTSMKTEALKTPAVNAQANAPANVPLAPPTVRMHVGSQFMNRGRSVFNSDSNTLVLGRYRPTHKKGEAQDWREPGSDSYVKIAKKERAAHFNMGQDWEKVKRENNITTDLDMFKQLNIPVLQQAIDSNKRIIFTHHPDADRNSMLYKEWQFLQLNGFNNLVEDRFGFWEAQP